MIDILWIDFFKIKGEIINEKDRCKECKGKKVTNETKILEVHVDKGMKDGQKITFRGEGDQLVSRLGYSENPDMSVTGISCVKCWLSL